MKLEQQMTIRKYLGRCEFDDDEFFAAVDAFDADLQAMQTPITAEALRGFGYRNDVTFLDGNSFVCDFDAFSGTILWQFDAEFNDDGSFRRLVDGKNRPVKNVRTMHDLNELVRLLGGAK